MAWLPESVVFESHLTYKHNTGAIGVDGKIVDHVARSGACWPLYQVSKNTNGNTNLYAAASQLSFGVGTVPAVDRELALAA